MDKMAFRRWIGFWMCLLTVGFFVANVYAAEEESSGSQVFELGEVVVSSERQAVNLATTVTEVTLEDIEAIGAQTVAGALDMIPGVDVQTGGKGQAHVSLRGFDQRDVKVLIDGVPAHESYYGSLDLSLIPVDTVSKITVTKGAASVLYGPNTMGGVINIITKKGGEVPETIFTTSFGDYNTRNYIFNHGAAVGKFNYWFTGGYRESDGFRLSDDFDEYNEHNGLGTDFNEDGGKRDLTDYIKRTIGAKIGYDFDEDSSIYLSFDYHNNERGCPTEFGRYWAFSKWNQWHLNLVGEHRFNDIITAKARLYYVDHDDSLKDASWDANHTTDPFRRWFAESAYDDYSVGGEFHTYFDFGDLSLLKLGFSFIRDNHKQRDRYDALSRPVWQFGDPIGWQPQEEYEADTYSIAIEDEVRLMDRLSFVLGISYDLHKPQKAHDEPAPDKTDAFNPQLGVVFNLTDKTDLHASIGKKIRFPQLIELYSDMAGGNPDLDPQKTIAYEIGATHRFSDDLKGSIAYFYNDVDDLIERISVAGNRFYVNIGEARIQGVELALDMNITDNFWAGANYTYLSTKDKDADHELSERPRHKINVDLRYEFPFGLEADVQACYTQRQFDDVDENYRKFPDFFLLNTRLAQKLPKKWGVGSELFVQAKNITDKDYDEGQGPKPGRTFLAGMTLRY